MIRIANNISIDRSLVTYAEYVLFLEEGHARNIYRHLSHKGKFEFDTKLGNKPILGVSVVDALAFCEWLTRRDQRNWKYRLPYLDEIGYELKQELRKNRAKNNGAKFWAVDRESGEYVLYGAPKIELDQSFVKTNLEVDLTLPKILHVNSVLHLMADLIDAILDLHSDLYLFKYYSSNFVKKALVVAGKIEYYAFCLSAYIDGFELYSQDLIGLKNVLNKILVNKHDLETSEPEFERERIGEDDLIEDETVEIIDSYVQSLTRLYEDSPSEIKSMMSHDVFVKACSDGFQGYKENIRRSSQLHGRMLRKIGANSYSIRRSVKVKKILYYLEEKLSDLRLYCTELFNDTIDSGKSDTYSLLCLFKSLSRVNGYYYWVKLKTSFAELRDPIQSPQLLRYLLIDIFYGNAATMGKDVSRIIERFNVDRVTGERYMLEALNKIYSSSLTSSYFENTLLMMQVDSVKVYDLVSKVVSNPYKYKLLDNYNSYSHYYASLISLNKDEIISFISEEMPVGVAIDPANYDRLITDVLQFNRAADISKKIVTSSWENYYSQKRRLIRFNILVYINNELRKSDNEDSRSKLNLLKKLYLSMLVYEKRLSGNLPLNEGILLVKERILN